MILMMAAIVVMISTVTMVEMVGNYQSCVRPCKPTSNSIFNFSISIFNCNNMVEMVITKVACICVSRDEVRKGEFELYPAG